LRRTLVLLIFYWAFTEAEIEAKICCSGEQYRQETAS